MTENQQNKTSVFVGLTVTDSAYQACAIQVRDGAISVLKDYAVPKAETNWVHFINTIEQDFTIQNCSTSLVFADRCVGFYRFDIPPVNESQIASVIASQAEIHLPLPIEQMRYHWRMLEQTKEKITVSVAAAKNEILDGPVHLARQAHADSVVLYSEAILKAVRFLSDNAEKNFCLLYLNKEGARLLFIEDGMLTKAVTFDCGLSSADEPLSEALLLCQDVQNSIAGYTANEPLALFLYSEANDSFSRTVESVLNDKGIEASRLSIRENPEYSTAALGAALIAADNQQHYDLFKGLYSKTHAEKDKSGSKNNIMLAAAACLLLVILIAVGYGADKYRLAGYDKQMNTPEFKKMQETHRLRSTIAQRRIDIPGIIKKINESVPKGVTVSSLSVQRGQSIAVGGHCKDPKLMYEFEEAMAKRSGVRTVRVTSRGVDKKKKQTAFTLTFDYKNFTQKKRMSK